MEMFEYVYNWSLIWAYILLVVFMLNKESYNLAYLHELILQQKC